MIDAITRQTRREAYVKRPLYRKTMILITLGRRQMTARQIAEELGFDDLNYVKPRLTELRDAGCIRSVRKTLDRTTNRQVTVWEAVTEGGDGDEDHMDQTY